MGIESDQVVYEYLSRVGDVAHQRQLPSSVRMRLVSRLRDEIDRDRAKATVDSPAAVRRILDRLGTPDEVVTAAGGTAGVPRTPSAAVPAQSAPRESPPRGLRRVVPRPRPADPVPDADAPSPPHLAGEHELGGPAVPPDWWRTDRGAFDAGDAVPGFVGGVEIPDLLKPPPTEARPAGRDRADKEPVTGEDAAPPAATPPARRRFPLPGTGWTNPLLLLAAAALVAGAVLGNWFALILGWLIAYGSRRLTPMETKWAVLVLPGLALTVGVVWLWGRTDGRWGAPVPEGHMNDALAETWPWVVRGAALASALYLVWRSQRRH